MAIVSETTWEAMTGQSVTGTASTSIAAICTAVDAAIKKLLLPYAPESLTVTDEIYDAPPTRDLILRRRPLRTVTSVYYRPDALGVVANFTSDYLLTAGTEYGILVDDPVNSWGASGIVRRLGGAVWGIAGYRSPGSLAYRLEPLRGSIKITYAAGETSVPSDIAAAAALMVSLLYARKESGAPFASESWNGRSQSLAGPYTAESALRSPDVAALLAPYVTPKFG
jgi:hypothetical protein